MYRGELTIPHNGSALRALGTLRPVDADDDERTATLRIEGREVGGPALATGMLRAHVDSEAGATRVVVVADVEVTGQRADPGAVEAGAQRLLDDVSERLDARIRERAGAQAHAAGPAPRRGRRAAEAAQAPAADARGAALSGGVGRGGLAVLAAAALLLLLRALFRPRRSVSVSLKYRW